MEIQVGEKNIIREMYYNRKYNDAIKRLMILYNKGYSDPMDNYFILYNLALYNMKYERENCSNDFTIAKYYISEAHKYFEPIKDRYEVEYHNIIWASIEMYKYEITNDETINMYTILYEYFKKIGYKRNEIGMYINILKFQGEYDMIPEILIDIKDSNDEEILDLIKDILQECNILGNTYYERALNIINERKNYVAL